MSILHRLILLLVGSALTACGGDLTLPDSGAPAVLHALSGDGQEGRVGRRLAAPLVVEVTDASSNPVKGVAVAFQFTNEVPGGEVDPAATTDSLGRASAEVRLGSRTGSHQIEARVASSATLSATFVVTAVDRERGRGGDGDDDDDDDDDD